jgi:TonB-linked SusC/RagA family outer membrane protein
MTKQLFAKAATIVMIFAASLLGMSSALAQNPAIRGNVVDSGNQPVIGAAVMVPGTTNGVTTDLDGKFEIRVAPGTTLEVSCIGYTAKRVSAANGMTIVLEDDAEMLEETVVIGYGVQKKSDLTGSVASVREDDLKNRSTSDAAAALQGKAAGVQVIQASGAPGKAAEIRVRGYSSNSGNIGPLLIVDGLKVDNIQYLDPEMIESMEVLKDAASAAIYGAEAGNGVVLITTKTGKKGEGKIFYNGQFQLSSLSRKLDIMNAADYIAFEKACGYLTDQALADVNYKGLDVNWSDEIFTPTWSNRHTVGFSGGNDRGNLYVSLNNVHNNGIVRGDKDVYDRLTFQVNADYKIKDWLTVGVNNSIERWSTKSVSEADDNGSFMLSAITSSPLFPAKGDESMLTQTMKDYRAKGYNLITDPETGLYWLAPLIGQTQSGHPFVRRDATDSQNGGFSIRGVAYVNFMPFKGFVFTSRFGYRIAQSNSHSYTAPYYSSNTVKSDNYNISASGNNSWYYQWENFINYNRTFGRHEVSAMAGMSYIENNWDNVSASASGTDILKGYAPNFRYLDYLLSDGVTKNINNAPGRSASLSYFGRLGYSYDNRYSIQANFRADAFDSSKLPFDKKWGYFPSVSAGWTISNEPFFKNNVDRSAVSFLKFRASWGVNGNINVLNNYPYSTSIMANSVYYQYDPDSTALSMGSIPSGLANPDLKWETSVQLDFGLDARLLNDRLTVGIDYFDKNTKDLLVGVSPVKEVGLPAFGDLGVATTVTVNAGTVNNKGVELELGWRDQIGDFGYSINGNISWLKNKVTYLDPTVGQLQGRVPQGCEMGTYFEQGHSVWYLLGYKAVGFDNEGNVLYQHADGTTGTDVTASDRFDLGSGIPNLTYGLTISLNWKGFDLTIFGNGIGGSKIFPTSWRPDRKECNTYSYYWANSWDNPAVNKANAKFPAADKWSTPAFSSTLTLFDGSYFKIKQIQLGYTLPKQLTQKAKINNLRIFASLDNYFTFTKYIGLDPETATSGGSASGIDMGNYPTAKSLILGVNLEF